MAAEEVRDRKGVPESHLSRWAGSLSPGGRGFSNHLAKRHEYQDGRNLSGSHHLLYLARGSKPLSRH